MSAGDDTVWCGGPWKWTISFEQEQKNSMFYWDKCWFSATTFLFAQKRQQCCHNLHFLLCSLLGLWCNCEVCFIFRKSLSVFTVNTRFLTFYSGSFGTQRSLFWKVHLWVVSLHNCFTMHWNQSMAASVSFRSLFPDSFTCPWYLGRHTGLFALLRTAG